LCFRFSVISCCFSHSTVLSHRGFHVFSHSSFSVKRQKQRSMAYP
jgi:hypothetical protein